MKQAKILKPLSKLLKKGFKAEGISSSELEDVLKPITCPKCSEPNSSTNRFCVRCATPLDQQSIQRILMQSIVETVIENLFNKKPEIRELARTELFNNTELKEKLSKLKHPEIQKLLEAPAQ